MRNPESTGALIVTGVTAVALLIVVSLFQAPSIDPIITKTTSVNAAKAIIERLDLICRKVQRLESARDNYDLWPRIAEGCPR